MTAKGYSENHFVITIRQVSENRCLEITFGYSENARSCHQVGTVLRRTVASCLFQVASPRIKNRQRTVLRSDATRPGFWFYIKDSASLMHSELVLASRSFNKTSRERALSRFCCAHREGESTVSPCLLISWSLTKNFDTKCRRIVFSSVQPSAFLIQAALFPRSGHCDLGRSCPALRLVYCCSLTSCRRQHHF